MTLTRMMLQTNPSVGLWLALIVGAFASDLPAQPPTTGRQQSVEPTTVLVVPFGTQSRTGADFGSRLVDELRDRINRTERYESADPADLRASLIKLGLTEEAAINMTCILGRQIAVQASIDIVICGTYQALDDDEYVVTATVVVPKDGSQSLIGPTRSKRYEEAAEAIVAQLVEQALDATASHSFASRVIAPYARCRINSDHVTALGDEVAGTVSYPLTANRDARSRYLVVGAAEQTSALVFGPDGDFQHRLGRPGKGPGEFGAIHLVHRWLGDSIAVWDGINGRFQVYPLTLGKPRLYRVAVLARRAAVLEDGTLVVNAQIRTIEQAGFALHIIGPEGTVVNSFDGTNSFRFDRPDVMRRALAPSSLGGIWAAPQTEYRLRRWSVDGTVLQDFSRDVSWFEPGNRYGPDPERPDQPPNPGLIDIIEDNRGFIWTILHVADEDWRSGLGQRPGMYGRVGTVVVDEQRYWDTVVEVVDPASGAVVAAARVDPALLGWADLGYAYSYREDQVGFPHVDVWRINLIC